MRPEEVEALVRARPWADHSGARELVRAFPDRLRTVLERWDLTVVRAFAEGAGLPVLEVVGRASGPAVLKLGGHGADLSQQVRVLQAADGRGFVRVLEHDEEQDAVLLEKLGPTLFRTVPDPVEQAAHLAALLPAAWALPTECAEILEPGAKARGLLVLVDGALAVESEPAESGGERPGLGTRHRDVLERARELALALIEEPAAELVLVHGDPHAGNALRRGEEHVLIDPDGFLGEREYDAGVALRDHQQMIDVLERSDGPGAGRRRHAQLVASTAAQLGLEEERVAAWAHLERVTTGIYLHRLGWRDEGEAWLRTARAVLS